MLAVHLWLQVPVQPSMVRCAAVLAVEYDSGISMGFTLEVQQQLVS